MVKTISKTTSMNVRLDMDTRRRLQAMADELGIPATTLVVANVKQMIRSGELRLTSELEPTPYLQKTMRQANEDIASHNNLSKVYDTADDFFKDLDKA